MRIGVIGAYGFTGKLICEELDKANLEFSAIGRTKEKLVAIQNRFKNCVAVLCADIALKNDINSVLESVELVVNCAGPFTEESKDFITAIASSGKTYLDITGEIGFIRYSFEELDSIAKENNTLMIHGCAFESMIVDLVANQIINKKEMIPSRLKSFYRFNSKRVSPGTRITMKLSKYREVLKIENGEWLAFDNADKLNVQIEDEKVAAVPYPLPELNFWSSLYSQVSAESYLIMDSAEAKFISINHRVEGDTLKELKEIKSRKNKRFTDEQRAAQRCEVFLCIDYENGTRHTVLINAKDMYSVTSKCILHSILRIAEMKQKPVGIVPPTSLFSGNEEKVMTKMRIKVKELDNFSYSQL